MAHRKKKLGEILVSWNLLSATNLAEALKYAEANGKRIGEALVELELCTEEDVTKALATQFDMEYVDLDRHVVTAEAVQLLPEDVIRNHLVLPMGKEDGRLKIIITDPLDLETLRNRALAFRPEMKKIRHTLDRVGFEKKSASLSYLPDFEIGVNRHKVLGEGSWWDVTLSFPIPLFFWQPARGEIAEAAANLRSLQKEAEHLENTISLEVEEAHTNALAAVNQIRLYQDEILTQAEEVYNMFLFSYQEGEIGGIELIDARRTLIEARTSYADALFNYRAALAALEKSIGQPLEGDLP